MELGLRALPCQRMDSPASGSLQPRGARGSAPITPSQLAPITPPRSTPSDVPISKNSLNKLKTLTLLS